MGITAKVLIAEQDQSVIRLLKTVLTNAGHRVVLAKTLEKANEALDEYEVDIALIDSGLEGAGGLELARTLKRDYPDIAVAFLSMFGSKRSALSASDAGVERFILKPFDDLASVNRTIKETLLERFERLRQKKDDGESEEEADEGTLPVNVIVADTAEDELAQMGEALEALKCVVTYATCAQEALLKLSQKQHDVLVVAYDMGDMTADDVLLRAKRLDTFVSVVVTAPDPNLTMTTNLIKKGASGFIEKPLKDIKRTAESIVRRGVAVVQLREEAAQEEEEEAQAQAAHESIHPEPPPPEEEEQESAQEEEEEVDEEEPDGTLKPDNDFELQNNGQGEPSTEEGEGEEEGAEGAEDEADERPSEPDAEGEDSGSQDEEEDSPEDEPEEESEKGSTKES